MAVRKLIDAWMETHNVRTLRFDFSDQPARFHPGQFVMCSDTFRGYAKPVRRAYSIASTPLEPGFVDITVKREIPGLMSVRLTEIPVGYEMEVSDPAGKYFYQPSLGRRVLLLGAGSGIVPLYSIARTILYGKQAESEVALFFSVRTPLDVIYDAQWQALVARYPNFRYYLTATRAHPDEWQGHRGRITPEWVRQEIPTVQEWVAFICGPGPMVTSMEELCRALAIPDERIHTEKW